jgi:erythromycin esterase-like protein
MTKHYLIILTALLLCACQSKTEDPQKDFLNYATKNAIDLNVNNNNKAFLPLKKAIGESQFVAVSEAAHNGKEFLAMNARLARFCVEEMGFTRVVAETGLPESRLVNDYILGKNVKGDWRRKINAMYSNWEEFNLLIEWLKEHNANLNDDSKKVQFVGLDITGGYTDLIPAFEQVMAYMDKVDAKYGRDIQRKLMPVLKKVKSEKPRQAVKQYRDSLSTEERYFLEKEVNLLIEHITLNEDFFVEKTNKEDYQWARQSTITLFQTINYYNGYVNKNNAEYNKNVGYNGRELAMAQNLKWVHKQDSTAKIFIINHNLHSMDQSQYLDDFMKFFTSMGAFIRKDFGDKYYSIGCAYNTGVYWENWKKNEEPVIKETEPAEEGEIDFELKKVGKKCFFVDFRGIDKKRAAFQWLQQPINAREHDEAWTITPGAHDAFIYYENISEPTKVGER